MLVDVCLCVCGGGEARSPTAGGLVHRLRPQETANVLWAFARLKVWDSALLEQLPSPPPSLVLASQHKTIHPYFHVFFICSDIREMGLALK